MGILKVRQYTSDGAKVPNQHQGTQLWLQLPAGIPWADLLLPETAWEFPKIWGAANIVLLSL